MPDRNIALGIDTSNYTTSVALHTNTTVLHRRQLLPVAAGERGLRQSDAVFHHTKQLPDMVEQLFAQTEQRPTVVAVSDRPTGEVGSYMPCFLAGVGLARSLSSVLNTKLYTFSHQQGHVAAALYGADKLDWIHRSFLAFHVSGGTTDALLVEPDAEGVIRCRKVAGSLDLKAGQLIDRIGVMMGLMFPAGVEMDKLSLQAGGLDKVRPSMDGVNCHLSGVENQCRALFEKGAAPQEVARFCFSFVTETLASMTERLLEQYGDLPLLYAGGVMSSRYISEQLTKRFGGCFAPAEFSADNAVGISVLGSIKNQQG